MKTVGIIGYGEIGRGLEEVYIERGFAPLIKDLDRGFISKSDGIDVLNICIPFSDTFIRDVQEYVKTLEPGITIIHSTVPPGTTEELVKKCATMYICHSPVRGVHPNLAEGIKTFVKVFGGPGARVAAKHYSDDLQVSADVFSSSRTTEVAKLLDTSYYGICIAWADYAQKLCLDNGIDFNEAQTKFNTTYNEGYTSLGKTNVVRPTLYPPIRSIGGHCVVPNAEILREVLDSKLLEAITDLK